MFIKIPYNRRELKDGEIVNNYGEISAVADFTVLAEERWEKHFPALAEKETVFANVARINAIPRNPENLVGIILSGIKVLFCFIETDLNFKEFARLFDPTDPATFEKQKEVLDAVFKVVNESSAVSPKN